MANVTDIQAPHGRNEDGSPKAPYGLKTDGTPRLSNRGAKPGQKGNGGRMSAPKATKARQNLTDRQRKSMLVELTQNLVVMPLAAISSAPVVKSRLGEKQADAIAIDSLILSQAAEPFADALIQLSQARPGVLSWMDTVEEKAPYLPMMMVGLSVVKALVSSHTNPNHDVANAARKAATEQAREMQATVERETTSQSAASEYANAPA